MTWITLELGRAAHDALRHIPERTRSVLRGVTTQSVGTIIKGLRAHFEREGGNDQCHLWAGPII